MISNPFIVLSKKFLGIDVGTSYIKVVELSQLGNRKKLENYGFLSSNVLYKEQFRTFEKSSLLLSTKEISRARPVPSGKP